MDKRRRLIILSLALVALAFTGAYALAGDGGGGDDTPAAPQGPQDAPAAIETPDGVEVPGAPPGGELPELQVPEPSATPDDADPGADPGPSPTATPGAQPTAVPQVPDPTAVPTAQPTPEPPLEEGGGED